MAKATPKRASERAVHFTDNNIRTLPPIDGKRTDYTDASWKKGGSLQLRVTSTGERTFSLVYRVNRKPIRETLGKLGTISLADARKKALRTAARNSLGHDLLAEKESATIGGVLQAYFDEHSPDWAEGTKSDRDGMLRTLPRLFMATKVSDATTTKAREAIRKTTKAPVRQNRVLSFLKASIRWAVGENLAPVSPILVMKKPNKEKRRTRALKGREITLLWRALPMSQGPQQGRQVQALIKLLLILGQRLGETLKMRWADLDLDKKLWHIPAADRKGEKGARLAHDVPLPYFATQIIKSLRDITGDEAEVFHRVSYANRSYWTDPVRNESIRLGLEYWKLHDLRRSCETGMGELGVPDDVADLVTGHQRKGTKRVYNVSERIEERRAALEKWADHVERLASGQDELWWVVGAADRMRKREEERMRELEEDARLAIAEDTNDYADQ